MVGSLTFAPQIRELVKNIVREVSNNGQRPFGGLHLRFEKDGLSAWASTDQEKEVRPNNVKAVLFPGLSSAVYGQLLRRKNGKASSTSMQDTYLSTLRLISKTKTTCKIWILRYSVPVQHARHRAAHIIVIYLQLYAFLNQAGTKMRVQTSCSKDYRIILILDGLATI